MDKKTFKQVSSSARTGFEKAQDAIRKRNIDYAIELLLNVLSVEPGFIDARELIRKLERDQTDNLGGMGKLSADMKIMFMVMKGRGKIAKSPREAMRIAEDALALNVYSIPALSLLADAAVGAKAFFIAIEALEIVREQKPKDISNIDRLAGVYQKAGMGRDVLRMRQLIADLKPGDLEAQQGVRQAAALASMKEGWEGDGDFTEKVKGGQDGAAALEKQDHAARNIDDINERITRLEEQLAAGETSVDIWRRLGDLYYRSKRYDDSVDALNKITEELGVLDPTVDRNIERANVSKLKDYIEELRQSGQEDQIPAIQQQIFDYRYERATDRVEKYPNDTELRFFLAEILWEGQDIAGALEQFQSAQRNPAYRVKCFVYMGRCFHAKKQFDMSIEQFNKANAELLVMDKEKMNAMYHMGLVYEDMGKMEEAVDCFKQIYQTNVNYRDVGKRIDAFYASQEG